MALHFVGQVEQREQLIARDVLVAQEIRSPRVCESAATVLL